MNPAGKPDPDSSFILHPSSSPPPSCQAVLVLSFGGPEEPADVEPFLDRVLAGKRVPLERRQEVVAHYQALGGRSPINAQNRALVAALNDELQSAGIDLPVYWGNRNWHPLLADTMARMAADGIRRALCFVTSAFGSYSGCRQYLEDIDRARSDVGAAAPQIDKLRLFYNHPGFIEVMAERTREAIAQLPAELAARAALVYTAHSIPVAMARNSPYEAQLREACRLVSERIGRSPWTLAFQSRSGPPSQPWLEPDIRDHLASLAARGRADPVVIVPIGFVSEHVEVLYDLDVEAAAVCREAGMRMVRAAPAGTHPRFVTMIRELVAERLGTSAERPALGTLGPAPDLCPADCCRREW